MNTTTTFGLMVGGMISLLGTIIGLVVKRGDDRMSRYDNGLWRRIEEQDKRIAQIQADADAKDTKIDALQTRIDVLLVSQAALREENATLKVELIEERAKREALESKVTSIHSAGATSP